MNEGFSGFWGVGARAAQQPAGEVVATLRRDPGMSPSLAIHMRFRRSAAAFPPSGCAPQIAMLGGPRFRGGAPRFPRFSVPFAQGPEAIAPVEARGRFRI
jgi:hypothetical protein